MQASKIKLGGEYAVRYDGELHSLRVTSLRSVRDYKGTTNYAVGLVIDADGSAKEDENGTVSKSYKVEDILGPFEEYSDMVKARVAKRAAEDAAKKAREDAAADLVRMLYRANNLPVPNKLDGYNVPFATHYAGGIEIREEGVAMLLAMLKSEVA
jgi:hypothetical protein